MERKNKQFQPLGVCEKLFNFFINGIVARGLKCITLGPPKVPPKAHSLIEIPITGSFGAYSVDSGLKKLPSSIASEGGRGGGGGGGIIAIGGIQTQLQKDVPTGRSSLRAIPLEGKESKNSVSGPSKAKEVDRTQVSPSLPTLEPAKTQNGSAGQVVPPTATDSATDSATRGRRRIISFKDEAEMGIIWKEKKPAKEKEKGKAPRPPLMPITRVPSNIDEKSDAFIRSRKEALSRSDSGLDSRSPS